MISVSNSAILTGDKIKWVWPVDMADSGIEGYLADAGNCATVIPPFKLTCSAPREPSQSRPDRITLTALLPKLKAMDSNKISTALFTVSSCFLSLRMISPPSMVII